VTTPTSTWGGPTPAPSKVITSVERVATIEYKVGDVGFSALGDRVVIVEDQFKSGYECETCGGSGKVPSTIAGGKPKVCPTCDGKGGLLVVPDNSQRRPTTGLIVSAGELCKSLKVGDSVLFSNFAGFAVDMDRAGTTVCLRILHETEVMCRVSGHLELRAMRNQSEVTSI
jgi:co-chaperonin GroES (HSP10)